MESLNCKSLMIGDWLYYKGQFNAFPFKVESITKKKVGYHAEPNEHRMYYLRLRECKPIPLTPEILEKNGIKKDINERLFGEYFEEDKDYSLEISMGKDGIYWSINYDEYRILKLEYVHKLQHALKLCGIKKEIEL